MRSFSAEAKVWEQSGCVGVGAEIRASNKAMVASVRVRGMVEEKKLAAIEMEQQEQRRKQMLRMQEEQKLRTCVGPTERPHGAFLFC